MKKIIIFCNFQTENESKKPINITYINYTQYILALIIIYFKYCDIKCWYISLKVIVNTKFLDIW